MVIIQRFLYKTQNIAFFSGAEADDQDAQERRILTRLEK
jgi:hypothetical protein